MPESALDLMPRLSPFDLIDGPSPAAAAAALALNPRDRADVERLLAKPVDFMASPLFDEPGAQDRLFDPADDIPRPEVGWYQPSMPRDERVSGVKAKQLVRLTAAQERILFYRYNYCRFRTARMQRQIMGSDVVSGPAVREMLAWHRRAQDLREWIAQINVALVPAMARRCNASDSVLPEFLSDGHLVLLASIDKFDAGRGFKFSSYACRAILKAFGRQAKKIARDHAFFPATYDPAADRSDHQEISRARQREETVDELRRIVLDNAADLSDIERSIIARRFPIVAAPVAGPGAGIGATAGAAPAEPLTLAQVGKLVGLTKERVRQLEVRALKKIRKALDEQWLA